MVHYSNGNKGQKNLGLLTNADLLLTDMELSIIYTKSCLITALSSFFLSS